MRETATTDNPQDQNSPSPFDDADVVRLLDKRTPRGSLGGFFVLVGDFFKAYPLFSIAIVVLSIVAGILETVGVATLFPAFEGIIADETESTSRITAIILEVFDALGMPPTIPWFLGIASILIVGKAIALFGALYTVGWIFTRVTANLRKELLSSVTAANWQYFVTQPVGRFAHAISMEAERGGQFYTSTGSLITHLFQVIVYFVVLFAVSWQVTLFAVAAGGGILLIFGQLIERQRRYARGEAVLFSDLSTFLADVVTNFKALKAMAAEAKYARMLSSHVENLARLQRRKLIPKTFIQTMREPLIFLGLIGGGFVFVGIVGISVLELMFMGFLFYRAVWRIAALQGNYIRAIERQEVLARLHALNASALDNRERAAPGVAPVLETGIDVHDLRFAYQDNPVLDGLTLYIPAKQITAIVGPSGSGKSTFIDILMRLHDPDGGEITVDGRPLQEIDLRAWRGSIGYIPQDSVLFHDTVRRNLLLSDEVDDDETIWRALRLAELEGVVRNFRDGLDTVVGERGMSISGGERQRLAIARAVIRRPSILILDEPTASLDRDTEMAFLNTLRALAKDVTVVIVSHQAEVAAMADRTYAIENGRAELRNGCDAPPNEAEVS